MRKEQLENGKTRCVRLVSWGTLELGTPFTRGPHQLGSQSHSACDFGFIHRAEGRLMENWFTSPPELREIETVRLTLDIEDPTCRDETHCYAFVIYAMHPLMIFSSQGRAHGIHAANYSATPVSLSKTKETSFTKSQSAHGIISSVSSTISSTISSMT